MQVTTLRFVRCHSRPDWEDGTPFFITPGSAYRLIKTVMSPATGRRHQIIADDGKERNYQAKHFEAPFTCIDGERTVPAIGADRQRDQEAA